MKKLLLLIVLLAALFASIPFLASTPFGKPIFLALLKTRLQGDLAIEKIDLSWRGPQHFEDVVFSNTDTTANIASFTSNVPFWKLSKLGDFFNLQGGTIFFPSYGNAEITNVRATLQAGKFTASGSTPQGGSLSAEGQILSRQSFDIAASLNLIPTIAVDELLKLQGFLYKGLGDTLNCIANLRFAGDQGAVGVELTATNGRASLRANIANGVLTLETPFTCSLQVTSDFSPLLLPYISPRILTDFRAQNPFTLKIAPEGFSCPISPFVWEGLRVDSATLNLGQIQVQSGDSLHFLVKLFKNAGFGKTIDVWFTPFSFSIQSGLIDMGRMDALLSQSIHLCTWGKVDTVQNQLQMFLGLPADTLEKSFGIKALSRNYVLKIPIRGPLSNPEFETGPAVAKIATMAASGQIPSTGGKVFGNVLNAVTQGIDGGDAPPANRPFPWER